MYVGEVASPPRGKKQKQEAITLSNDELYEGPLPHQDALVIKMDINNAIVHYILVDTGSLVNVMYYDAFTKLELPRSQLKEVQTPLSRFIEDSVETKGFVVLLVEIAMSPNIHKLDMEFIVLTLTYVHNIILWRSALQGLKVIVYMEKFCMKFPTPNGIGVVRENQRVVRSCYIKSCKTIGQKDLQVHTVVEKIFKEEPLPRVEPVLDTDDIVLDPTQLNQVVKISTGLVPELRAQIVYLICRFNVVFAWVPKDMSGIDRSTITHKLL